MKEGTDYDLIILGGGAAGFSSAIVANGLGARTAMVNTGLPLGGTCVNVGCVPTKHMLEIARLVRLPHNGRFRGLTMGDVSLDLRKVVGQKDELVSRLREEKYRSVLDNLDNVDLIEGRGGFVNESAVQVNGETLEADRFMIATGSSTHVPPIPGLGEVPFMTNVDILALDEVPEDLIVLGGGPLALEFSYMFNAFGSRVTLLQRSHRILSRGDPEVSLELRKHLEEDGIRIETGLSFEEVSKGDEGFEVAVKGDRGPMTVAGSHLLLATGVRANTQGLGLEGIGVSLDGAGSILVDEFLRTDVENIGACGDVIGHPRLETTAAREGNLATRNLLSGTKHTIDYDTVPYAVFTDPQVASVGITEEELMGRLNVCACRTVKMEMVPKARAVLDTRGLVKMVVDPNDGRIVGVQIVSALASEMIHEATLAVRQGMTVDELINTVHVFPTLSEAMKLAALSFRQDISKLSCCTV